MAPSPHLDAVPGLSWLCSLQICTLLGNGHLCPTGELILEAKVAGAHVGMVAGNWLESQAVCFNLLPSTCFGSKQALACSSQVESRFLTALLLVLLVFKPAKGTHLPGVGPQG